MTNRFSRAFTIVLSTIASLSIMPLDEIAAEEKAASPGVSVSKASAGGTTDPAQAASAQPSSGAPRANIDPFTDQVIERLSEYLATAKVFSFQADVTSEQLLPSGYKIELSRSVEIMVRRPDRLRAEVLSDDGTRRYFYDGETLSVHDLEKNVYAIVEVPDTIDGMIDRLRDRFDMSLPLADLVVSDIHENFEENVVSGTYAGRHLLLGERHHHLLFSNGRMDYQVWVEDGARPLPRKITVIEVDEPGGHPRVTMQLSRWDFTPRLPDMVFEFYPPADADEVEISPVESDESSASPPGDSGDAGQTGGAGGKVDTGTSGAGKEASK